MGCATWWPITRKWREGEGCANWWPITHKWIEGEGVQPGCLLHISGEREMGVQTGGL